MRVISGTARGRKLKANEGLDTRPTSDRVKESVFNIILRYVFDAEVLDLFGGTGNLGIEALSRGAKHCVFVEQNKKSCDILRENVVGLGFKDSSDIYQTDAFSALTKLNSNKAKFDLIFLDPPYGMGYVEKAIKEIDKLDLLSEDGLIVSEFDNVDVVPEEIGEFKIDRVQKYGRVRIAFWKRGLENE